MRVLECSEIKTDPADQPVPEIMAEGAVLVIKPVTSAIEIGFDDWMPPHHGVAFVWTPRS